jgi:hypothetical protein
MKTFIVLLPIDEKPNGREYLESIENEVFDIMEIPDCLEYFTLSEFMDKFNNEEVEQNGFWLGYIQVKG